MAVEIQYNYKGDIHIDKDGTHLVPCVLEVRFYPQVDIVQVGTALKGGPDKKMSIGDTFEFSFGGYNFTIKKMNDTGFMDKKMINFADRRRQKAKQK